MADIKNLVGKNDDNLNDIVDIFDYKDLELHHSIILKINKYIKSTKNLKRVNVKEYINSLSRQDKYKNGDFSLILKLYM